MPTRDLSDLVQKINVGNRDRLIYTNPERNTPLQKPGTGTKTLCRSNILFSEELSIKVDGVGLIHHVRVLPAYLFRY